MKVTLDWLKEYVNFKLSAEEVAEKITLQGLEVDGITYVHYDFNGVFVGTITTVEAVADSDHLSRCQVDVGNRTLQVVCGAPNVRSGLKVPVAVDGALLPNNIRLKTSTIKGVASEGMICSAAELGISNQSDIVLELDNQIPDGLNLKEYLEKGEAVIEIDVTANRPDCLGVIGVAREVAVFSGSRVKKPEFNVRENSDQHVDELIKVVILNPENCPRYTARYIENVTIGPSPLWLVKRLEAVGIRSINNVVDITNFVMMETGQPLHAFDYDTIADGTIVVRNAKPDESFTTLDEVERKLDEESCMICDAQKPVALGGIMGGLNSEITGSTTRILLESAYFNPDNIRRTSKKMGLSTDSSQRFERGVDYDGVVYALNRATALFCELGGGVAAHGYVDNYPNKIEKTAISLRPSRLKQVLGIPIDIGRIEDILRSLEFDVNVVNDVIHVNVPSHRPDVSIEEDLIEEVARIYGYNNITGNISAVIKLDSRKNSIESFSQEVRDISTGIGYLEIVTNTLIQKSETRPFCVNEPIDIRNPLSEDLASLRSSLIPSALIVARWNLNRQNRSFKLFEIGNTFHWLVKGQQHEEQTKIVYLGTGNIREGIWAEPDKAIGFHDIKGDLELFCDRLNVRNVDFQDSSYSFFDHRQLDLTVDGARIGCLGSINRNIQKLFEIKNEIFVAELDFHELLKHKEWEKTYNSIPKFPSIFRDLSFLVDVDVPSKRIIAEIWQAGGEYLRSVKLYDLFTGKQIENNKKSLTFSLVYFSEERTLTEEEVDSSISQIIDSLKQKLNINLRT